MPKDGRASTPVGQVAVQLKVFLSRFLVALILIDPPASFAKRVPMSTPSRWSGFSSKMGT